jgi:hypothetical protein
VLHILVAIFFFFLVKNVVVFFEVVGEKRWTPDMDTEHDGGGRRCKIERSAE